MLQAQANEHVLSASEILHRHVAVFAAFKRAPDLLYIRGLRIMHLHHGAAGEVDA